MLGRCGRSSGRDLDHRADHDERPVGRAFGDAVEQLDIEPLVDHAEEAKPRARQRSLVGRIVNCRRAPVPKWARSTDDGNGWTLSWRSFLASYRLIPPVKTTSAASISSLLEREQLGRRETELATVRPCNHRPVALASRCRENGSIIGV